MARSTRAPEEIRGKDVPLVLGGIDLPPDAATDPDYEMPDAETKGYHTGQVRQPAEPVYTPKTGVTEFESVTDQPSKFERGSLKELKDAHNDDERGGVEGEVLHTSITPFTDAIGERAATVRRQAAQATAPATPTARQRRAAARATARATTATPAATATAGRGTRARVEGDTAGLSEGDRTP